MQHLIALRMRAYFELQLCFERSYTYKFSRNLICFRYEYPKTVVTANIFLVRFFQLP